MFPFVGIIRMCLNISTVIYVAGVILFLLNKNGCFQCWWKWQMPATANRNLTIKYTEPGMIQFSIHIANMTDCHLTTMSQFTYIMSVHLNVYYCEYLSRLFKIQKRYSVYPTEVSFFTRRAFRQYFAGNHSNYKEGERIFGKKIRDKF
jgi:hypothetical protein